MKSLAHGGNTSKAEVTHISLHGVWLLSSKWQRTVYVL